MPDRELSASSAVEEEVCCCSSTGGADKSLPRPGRKQVTATEDFEFHISYLLS